MTLKIFSSILVPLVIFVGPTLATPERLPHPALWLGVLVGIVTLLSQPSLGPRRMVSDPGDRCSGLKIFVGVIGAQLVAVMEFAFRAELRPAPTAATLILGFLIAISGLGLRLWAIRTLGRFFTSTVTVQDGQQVIDVGPYRVLRHPAYTGTLLSSLGVTLALESGLGLMLVFLLAVPSYLYRISVEEKTLLGSLGEDYHTYSTRTWSLVPFVF